MKKIPIFGEESSAVAVLQCKLNSLGAKLIVDGIFGLKTRDAIFDYKAAVWVDEFGLGPKTMARLGFDDIDQFEQYEIPSLDRLRIADAIVSVVEKDIKENLRESGGKNRGKRIDEFNLRAGSYLGAPYCASGLWCAIDDACQSLGLKNPLSPTASSQFFRRPQNIPPRHLKSGKLGLRGDIAVFQSPNNTRFGHVGILTTDQGDTNFFLTAEYNTDKRGSRDGDGAYFKRRSNGDKRLNRYKKFICFADVPQMIFDVNTKVYMG